MNAIDSLIVENAEVIRFFGLYLVIIFFSVGIILLVIAIVFRSKSRALPSQKGRTEFARFYSNPANLIQYTTNTEAHNDSSVARSRTKPGTAGVQQQIPPPYAVPADSVPSSSVPSSAVVEYYFDFDDQYYLPDDP